jgi:hypothetical protein
MPGPTRVCTGCAAPHEASRCTCVRTTSQQGLERRSYYCPSCAGALVRNCHNCSQPQRANDLRSVVSYTGSVLRPSSASFRLCPTCIRATTRTCQTCGGHICDLRAVQSPNPFTCTRCTHLMIPCARCGQTPTAPNRTNVTADYFRLDSLICQSCANGLAPTTFQVNRSRRKVGYELEFLVPDGRASSLNLVPWGTLKEDGSVYTTDSDGALHNLVRYRGREFASAPTSGDQLLHTIDKVCDQLASISCIVNPRCGLHVHLDMDGEPHENCTNIQNWWYNLERGLFLLCRQSRWGNHFCKPGINSENERYSALNLSAYRKHGTYEIRMHHATLEPETIKAWCLTLLAFFDTFHTVPWTSKASSLKTPLSQLQFILKQCKLPSSLRRYALETARLHWKNTIPSSPPARRPFTAAQIREQLGLAGTRANDPFAEQHQQQAGVFNAAAFEHARIAMTWGDAAGTIIRTRNNT